MGPCITPVRHNHRAKQLRTSSWLNGTGENVDKWIRDSYLAPRDTR